MGWTTSTQPHELPRVVRSAKTPPGQPPPPNVLPGVASQRVVTWKYRDERRPNPETPMKDYESTWPLAAAAVVVGVAVGTFVLGGVPELQRTHDDVPIVEPRDGLRGYPGPVPRPLPPPRYRPPMVLSNSGTYDALEDLKSPRAEIRAGGAGRLSLSAEPERVLPELIGALEHDDDPFVRLVSAQSIGRLGAEEGLAPLMRAAANDPSERVRAMAVAAHDSLMARVPVERSSRP